jgi:hypothetical protein
MKPYSTKRMTKGIGGCRKSKASPHRKRCLRVDKRAARQIAKKEIQDDEPGKFVAYPTWPPYPIY